ncbi:alkyl hydroperoxide reductase [Tateyamaria omphalii]|uniref:redoxin domain-containing protein n=1 Tax=Tateyamaria omphalii TaxID=299262 RepID=UPI001677B85E|nr:redoxin domain-containing protein [Tateyamaria omphalii]GGX71285.1 alkyl hydroperoxide reductase [Tateyamaria omphalii]
MPKQEEPIGPEVGALAPNNDLKDDTGSALKLFDLMGDNGVAVAFVRSLGWCPFCKKQIRLLNEVRDDLEGLGWNVVSLTYDAPEVLQAFRKKTGVHLDLLSDEGSAAIDAYDLRNKGVKPGGKSVGVPHAAVVFVGKDGTVKEMLRHKGYQTRPSAEDVVAAAKALSN